MERHVRIVALAAAALACAATAVSGQKPKPKPTAKPPAAKPPQNQTVAQGQLVGGNGQFGTVYSLKDGFNFEILSAKYTMEPYNCYGSLVALPDQKLVIVDIAIKNITKGDLYWGPDGWFTLVDDKGQLYQGGAASLKSNEANSNSANLRPGQGLGQPELKDPLRMGWAVPARARIVKIMVNKARVGKNEEVFRYYIAGATKAEAGEEGDPKNVIAPLPDNVKDPADKSGAVALDEGKAVVGTYVPSGYFNLRLDSFAFSTEPLNGNPPEEGKKWAIATMTARNEVDRELSIFEVYAGEGYEITDSDGERSKAVLFRKAKRDEDIDHTFKKKGEEYTYRVIFQLPKDATVKTYQFAGNGVRKWTVDVSAVK